MKRQKKKEQEELHYLISHPSNGACINFKQPRVKCWNESFITIMCLRPERSKERPFFVSSGWFGLNCSCTMCMKFFVSIPFMGIFCHSGYYM